MNYESVRTVESNVAAGVKYQVRRMSFARRLELMKEVRELARRLEFLEGSEEHGERMDAALVQAEIDRVFLKWGLKGITGLQLDGAEATPELLASVGPEAMLREALAAVRHEAGLSEDERKN